MIRIIAGIETVLSGFSRVKILPILSFCECCFRQLPTTNHRLEQDFQDLPKNNPPQPNITDGR